VWQIIIYHNFIDLRKMRLNFVSMNSFKGKNREYFSTKNRKNAEMIRVAFHEENINKYKSFASWKYMGNDVSIKARKFARHPEYYHKISELVIQTFWNDPQTASYMCRFLLTSKRGQSYLFKNIALYLVTDRNRVIFIWVFHVMRSRLLIQYRCFGTICAFVWKFYIP